MRNYVLIAALVVTIVCLGIADVVYVMAFSRTARATETENAILTRMMNEVSPGPDLKMGIPEIAAAAGVDAKSLVARCRSSFNFTDADLQIRLKRSYWTTAIETVREFRRPLEVQARPLSRDDLAALVFAMAVSDKAAKMPAE